MSPLRRGSPGRRGRAGAANGNPIGFESWGSRWPQTVTLPPAQARLWEPPPPPGRDAPWPRRHRRRRRGCRHSPAWAPEPDRRPRGALPGAGSRRPDERARAAPRWRRSTSRRTRPRAPATRTAGATSKPAGEDVNAAFCIGQALTHCRTCYVCRRCALFAAQLPACASGNCRRPRLQDSQFSPERVWAIQEDGRPLTVGLYVRSQTSRSRAGAHRALCSGKGAG